MAYKENQTRVVEIKGTKLSVGCDIDWNGRPNNSDVTLNKINGMDAHWIETFITDEIVYLILDHEYEGIISNREMQAEAHGDESRGN